MLTGDGYMLLLYERSLPDGKAPGLVDYKFMCFNGRVECSFVCSDRASADGLKVTIYDRQWKRLPFERHYRSSPVEIGKPENYEKMVEIAEKLSEGMPFVRVALYEADRRIYFGELTFFPGCGFEEFRPDEWDMRLGGKIELPQRYSYIG